MCGSVRYRKVYWVSSMCMTCSACSDWLWSGFSAVQPPDATGQVRSFSSARRWASLRPLTAARTDLKNTQNTITLLTADYMYVHCVAVFKQDEFKVAELPSKHVLLLLVQLFGNITHPMWTPRIKPVWSERWTPSLIYSRASLYSASD